jgi:type I restriction enzyme, S subunit
MPSEWPVAPLEALTEYLNRGSAPSYVETGGVAVLNQKCIRDWRVDFGSARRTNHARRPIAEARFLRPGDVVVNSTGVGTLGRVAQVGELPESATVDSHVTIVRPDAQVVDARFLGYAMKHRQAAIEALGHGSTGQTELARAQLGALVVPVPPRRDQVAIGDVLAALDDKIELNRRMGETLEETLLALFKGWSSAIDAREALEDPGAPQTPAGWQVGVLGDVADITMGQSPPGSTYNTTGDGLPFFQGATDFGAFFATNRVYCSAPTRYADEWDILMSVRAPVGRANIARERCAIGRGVASIRSRSGTHPAFVWCVIRSLAEALDVYNGEGTVFGSISKKGLHSAVVRVPPPEVIASFERTAGPLVKRLRLGEDESRTLAEIRDALLPKLISGELRILDAERLVSEVT